MSLRTHLLQLLAPCGPGDEVVPGAELVGVLLEIGLGWRFRTADGDVNVEVSLLEDTERFAARTPRLALSYRALTHTPERSRAGKTLCEALVPIVARNEDAVLAAIERETAAEGEGAGGSRVREVQVDTALEAALDSPSPFFTITPYVGCVIGCRFCYAQAPIGHMRRLARAPVVPWGSYVDVRVNLPDVLARELVDAPPWPIKFCPILSDPYQAVESRYGVTRARLEVMRAAPPRPVFVLTRSRLIERDTALLAALPAWVGASIPTFDDDVRRHFEPRAASIAERFAMLRTLRAAGVETFAVVQPMLPGPVEAFADALAESVSSVSIDVLYGVQGATADFADASFAAVATEDWQRERALALIAALERRGVTIWRGDLPPSLA